MGSSLAGTAGPSLLRWGVALAVAVGVIGTVAAPVTAQAPLETSTTVGVEDPWFGRDKVLHFGVSAALAAGGYAVGTRLFDHSGAAVGFGSAVALTAGGLKEWSDSRGNGTASWRDMAWNVLGTAVGAGVAHLIDRSRSDTSALDPNRLESLAAKSNPGRLFVVEPAIPATTRACRPNAAAPLLIPSICLGNFVAVAGVGR